MYIPIWYIHKSTLRRKFTDEEVWASFFQTRPNQNCLPESTHLWLFKHGGVTIVSILIGCLLSGIGMIGVSLISSYPFTGHDTMMLTLLFIFSIMTVVGVLSTIFSIVKKRNEDALKRLNNIGQEGTQLGVCPKCKINITQGTQICPKCGTKITNHEGSQLTNGTYKY